MMVDPHPGGAGHAAGLAVDSLPPLAPKLTHRISVSAISQNPFWRQCGGFRIVPAYLHRGRIIMVPS